MKLRAYRWFARSSGFARSSALTLCLFTALAETRPHYGGTLRVQLVSMYTDADKLPLTSETLVRIDERGEILPVLARGWQGEKNRWRFLIRNKVVAPSAVAARLAPLIKEWDPAAIVTSAASSLIIQTDHPIGDLLERLARPEAGIPGTGPFRMSKWEAGRRAVLETNEDYSGGRPFIDAVEFTSAAPRNAPYQLSAADIWELPVGVSRRLIPDGMRLWTSTASDLLGLWLNAPTPALRDALSLSIDRGAIVNVLMQRRGEAAAGLLPQWLSGYEFLFTAPFDPARARDIAKSLPSNALTLSFEPADALARSVAGRVIVNARDGGLNLHPVSPASHADIDLRRVRVDCLDAARALKEISGRSDLGDSGSPDALYHAERKILDEGRIVPLVHAPQVFGIGARVHVAGIAGLPSCDLLGSLTNVWLSP